MKKPIIYTITNCPWCMKVKRYLKSKGVEYEERNIETNESYRKECETLSGDVAVPITTVNEKDYIFKFDRDAIDKMLNE